MLWKTNGDNGRVLREPTSSFLSFRHRVHSWRSSNVVSNLQLCVFEEKCEIELILNKE
jgi:hypothetical protein